MQGESLKGGVVARHADDGGRPLHEGERFGGEVAGFAGGVLCKQFGEVGAFCRRHHGTGEDDAAPAIGQAGAGEGFGEGVAVLTAAEQAEGVGGLVLFAGKGGFLARERVGVAEVGDGGVVEGVEVVGGSGVVVAQVAVDPDGIVVATDGVEGREFFPLTGDGCGLVNDVAQAEGDAAAARALGGKRRVEFVLRAARDVIDDQQVGREGVQRGGNGVAAQGGKVGNGDVEVAGAVVAVCLFVVGGQGQAVDAGRQRVGTAFTDAGDKQDGRRKRRLAEGAGKQAGAADVAEAHGVV